MLMARWVREGRNYTHISLHCRFHRSQPGTRWLSHS